ncbi:hypothetical protein TNCV_1619451 [Trichonephila clavipes]|nr:hypothetical protein TNCV_1619451 [Trichonephila clavipes]
MVLKATANDRNHLALCNNEFRWPRSGLCRTDVISENASQAAEIVNSVYDAETVTANDVQFWFRRFCSGTFHVKVAPSPSTKMSIKSQKVDRHVGSRSIALEGQTLNSDIYCQQLNCLNLVTDQKRPELASRRGVVFHQDNATPHTSVVTRHWSLFGKFQCIHHIVRT